MPLLLNLDNLKAAVLKADWFDPEINPKLADFCRHYRLHVMPCRPYKPQHRHKGPIFPLGWRRNIKLIREHFGLNKPEARDILRHSFISNHVMGFGSFAATAIESGNSETVIRKHYFNRVSKADAQRFWQIAPADEPANIVPMAYTS